MYTLEFNQYVWEEELQVLQMQHFYLGINIQTTFWLRQELKEPLCLFVCLSVCSPTQSSIKVSQSSSLSGLSQVSLWSLSGLFRISLSAFLAHFVGQTEPKILRLVDLNLI